MELKPCAFINPRLHPKHLSTPQDDFTIIRAWQEIVAQAIRARATDIHIEAHEDKTAIRIRVDGELQPVATHTDVVHERIIARIKVLARLDIAEQRLPQDGRLLLGLNYSKPDIDCRVSILPTLHGEKAVLRLLPSNTHELNLKKIGLHPEQETLLVDAITQPDGLILVTGPTGSGKTRTLYSCLNQLNHSHLNLCSIEDPIEIRLQGVNQVAYHPKAGLDFNCIVRAMLRQDPDVILIGEIRDAATAKLAIQAAQTGHLVLSTLHTRSAIASAIRLRSLGISYDELRACLRCVTSQRLVRTLCSNCQGHSRDSVCSQCAGSGLFGRIGVHEVLPFSSTMADAFERYSSITELTQFAKSVGFEDMRVAGMRHITQERISPTELLAQIGSWH